MNYVGQQEPNTQCMNYHINKRDRKIPKPNLELVIFQKTKKFKIKLKKNVKLKFYLKIEKKSQWMIAQMVERLLVPGGPGFKSPLWLHMR